MDNKKRVVLLLTFALVIIFPGTATAELPKIAFFGSAPQGTLLYTLNSVFAKSLQTNSPIKARVQPASGPSALLPSVNNGKLEFSINGCNDARLALIGEKPFVPSPNLRLVSVVSPVFVSLVVRNDSDIKTVADIKGRKISSNFAAQIAGDTLTKAILANQALSYDDVRAVPVPNMAQGLKYLLENKVDATIFAVAAAKLKEINATIPGGVRLLSLENNAKAAEAMAAIYPGSYAVEVKKGTPGFTGVFEDIFVLGYDLYLVTSEIQNNEFIYTTLKTFYNDMNSIQKGHSFLKHFNENNMAKDIAVIPYHDGAVKFYKEVGIWTKKMDANQSYLLSLAK